MRGDRPDTESEDAEGNSFICMRDRPTDNYGLWAGRLPRMRDRVGIYLVPQLLLAYPHARIDLRQCPRFV